MTHITSCTNVISILATNFVVSRKEEFYTVRIIQCIAFANFQHKIIFFSKISALG